MRATPQMGVSSASRKEKRGMSALTLRSLRPNDLPRLSEIESRIAGRPRRAFFEKRLAVATATPESFITCAALEGEKVVGYGFARLQEGEFGATRGVAVLDVIGVDPDFQRRGIGKAVISGIEQRMNKKGIETLRTQTVWTDHVMSGFFSSVGFTLAPSQIIERDTSPLSERVTEVSSMKMDGVWRVHGAGGDDYSRVAGDKFLIRSLREEDFSTVVRIDNKLTGRDHSAYYEAKFKEMLVETGIRVSLVAEDADIVAGFIMARLDYGEFGKTEQAASIDTIGVHPAYKRTGMGHALLSQLLINLSTLKVDSVRTQVSWKNFELQQFLHAKGFAPSQRLLLVKTCKG
jgi:ribosomal protein S18 acetylase RimI-like enzyme